MFNYIQTDNTLCYVKTYPHFISNEEIFAYAFYIGYLLSSNHDYRGMNRLVLNFISLEINASYNYTDFCTKCGDVYNFLSTSKDPRLGILFSATYSICLTILVFTF